MADCLTTLIGITPAECPCFEGIDAGYTDSDSGYYLTDPLYGIPNLSAVLATRAQCEPADNTVYNTLNEARQSAIRDIRTDLMTALSRFREGAGAWRGVIAKNRAVTGTVNSLGKNGTQLYSTRRLIDASFVITDLFIGANFTGTVDVKFESNHRTFTQADITCNTVAGTFEQNMLVTPVTIPLYDAAEQELFYNLYWEPTGVQKPLTSSIWCCGGPGAWAKFVQVGGFNLATLEERTLYRSSTASGILIGGYISCAKLDFICNLDELNGYDWKELLGRTLLFKSAIYAFSQMISSDQVNLQTLLNAEQAGKRMKELSEAYATNIEYIAKSLPTGFSGCWGCNKSDFQISKIRT